MDKGAKEDEEEEDAGNEDEEEGQCGRRDGGRFKGRWGGGRETRIPSLRLSRVLSSTKLPEQRFATCILNEDKRTKGQISPLCTYSFFTSSCSALLCAALLCALPFSFSSPSYQLFVSFLSPSLLLLGSLSSPSFLLPFSFDSLFIPFSLSSPSRLLPFPFYARSSSLKDEEGRRFFRLLFHHFPEVSHSLRPRLTFFVLINIFFSTTHFLWV